MNEEIFDQQTAKYTRVVDGSCVAIIDKPRKYLIVKTNILGLVRYSCFMYRHGQWFDAGTKIDQNSLKEVFETVDSVIDR